MAKIPCSDLQEYIPHRPPMIWVDEVLSYEDKGGTTALRLKEDGTYLSDGRLRSSAFIEIIAQSYAFTLAAYTNRTLLQAPQKTKTLLAGIKSFDILSQKHLKPGDQINIRVRKLRELGPITVISGEALEGESVLAKGEIKIFAQVNTH